MRLDEFEAAILAYQPQLVRFAQTWVGDEAEDIVQNTLFELYEKQKYLKFRQNGSATVTTWLCKCIELRCLDFLRKDARRNDLEAAVGVSSKHRYGMTTDSLDEDDSKPADQVAEADEENFEQSLHEQKTELIREGLDSYYETSEHEAVPLHRFRRIAVSEGYADMPDDEAIDKRQTCQCIQIEVRRILRSLETELRSVVTLYHFGRPTTLCQVAKELGLTPRTVQVRLEKAESIMRQRLMQAGFGTSWAC